MRIGNGKINSIDITEITDSAMPKSLVCPHCRNRNRSLIFANDNLMEFGKHIEQCKNCGSLHLFRLNMTDDFKKKIVDFLMKEDKQ